MAKQYIILKADDMRYDPDHILPSRWLNFTDYIVQKNIRAALGIIGNSLEEDHPDYFDHLKTLHDSAHFELWNHGYDHVLKATNDQGEVYHEFFNTPKEHQKEHVTRTQSLALEKLDITLRTFGAPGNGVDEITTEVIDEDPDIQVWLYGKPQSQKYVLKRSVNVEHPTHSPDFSAFLNQYDADIPCLTLQLHPNSWDENRFAQFDQIMQFLLHQDCNFILPYAYFQLQCSQENE